MNPTLGDRLTFDLSQPGRSACTLPPLDVPQAPLPPADLLRRELNLPELGQVDLIRYFLALSRLNYSIDTGFYPLGSCTMKYNPKMHEDLARLPGFAQAHPLQPVETAQGALALMYDLQRCLAEITGLDAVSLAPAAGAQGELTGMLIVKAYLADSSQEGRTRVLVPDSAHGTNPASATMAGFQVVTVPTDAQGNTDMAAFAAALDDGVAAMMFTLPNTLGLCCSEIGEIAQMLHRRGALLYGDGANLNAILGRARLGDMGFDIVHLNMHKTFSTPHGGGGPGAGPVAVKGFLAPYLPTPVVEKARAGPAGDGDAFVLATPERSIGRMGLFHGHFGVLLRAYAYIRTLGTEGLRQVSENAVINANYVLARLREAYHLPYDRRCMHEVVFSGSGLRQGRTSLRPERAKGVRTWDIAKRLIDYGFHPPTVYFPLIVNEALMIEPTETESKEALDAFCDALLAIAREAEEEPQVLLDAPHDTPVGRLDEAAAARRPVLRWRPLESEGRETHA